MDEVWKILELEPTRDIAAIKRAYARLTAKYHPEEDPEGFLRLREMYQKALAWAENGASSEETAPAEESGEDGGWTLRLDDPPRGPNPCQDCEAAVQFRTLYSGRQRDTAKAWMDYFTSEAFLTLARNPDFTALLLEEVEAQEEHFPPGKAFLSWLYIAYQLVAEKEQDSEGGWHWRLHPEHGAAFDGMESICRIAVKGPVPRRPERNDRAMSDSFADYNRLLALADCSGWKEQALSAAGQIIDCYRLGSLQEKCSRWGSGSAERHPAGLRLLEHFFRRSDLPEELYRILWTRLDLKSALFGRAKVLYGGLRARVLERVPGIAEEAELNVLQLNKDYDICRRAAKQLEESGSAADREKAREITDVFFEGAEFQKALRNRRFVEEQLLRYWLRLYWCGTRFLERLLAFYQDNPDAPCAEQVAVRVEEIRYERMVSQWTNEDKAAPVPEKELSLAFRPFFRHWLNTGFYTAQHPDSGKPLLEYLNESLPYLPEWSGRFLEGPLGAVEPRTVTAVIDGAEIDILFHLRHIEYRIDGQPVYQPCLPWELLVAEGGNRFFHLLPLALTFYDQLFPVYEELLRRLEDTAAPEAHRGFLAACLASHVCRLPVPETPEEDPLALLPLELFEEGGGHLYGGIWFARQGTLTLFEQTETGRFVLPDGQYSQLFDEETALALARRVLKETASPAHFNLSLLQTLPDEAYALPLAGRELVYRAPWEPDDWDLEEEDPEVGNPPDDWSDGDIGIDTLENLLLQFAAGNLRRLVLRWSGRETLVFVHDKAGYACFLFLLSSVTWFSMLSLPEVYRSVDSAAVVYVPFGLGKLADYCVHHDASSILRNLDLVFTQIGRGQIEVRIGDRWIWASHTSLQNGEHSKHLAQQKLAGLAYYNYELSKFVLNQYPTQLESLTLGGERTLSEIRSGSYGQAAQALIQFMQKKLARLRLTWTRKDGAQRHIVLLQDAGRFMMVWLRDDARQAEFYVADKQIYMDVEGKKYPKDTFLGRTVPAYLVHADLKRIRNVLDLMLDDMPDPDQVTAQFAEFAWESPVKQQRRPYEEIRDELVQDAPQ